MGKTRNSRFRVEALPVDLDWGSCDKGILCCLSAAEMGGFAFPASQQ